MNSVMVSLLDLIILTEFKVFSVKENSRTFLEYLAYTSVIFFEDFLRILKSKNKKDSGIIKKKKLDFQIFK